MKLTTGTDSGSARRAKGAIMIDGQHIADTLQCVHCNMHWQVIHGSGTVRGFCMNCFGPTCGQERCDPCIPFEKKLDEMEKRKIGV